MLYWNAYSDIIDGDRRFGTKPSDLAGGGGNISILDIYSVSKMTFDIVSQSL